MSPGSADPPEGFDLDEDLDEFIEMWRKVDRHAAAVLREALAEDRGVPPPRGDLDSVAARVLQAFEVAEHPSGWIRKAAGLENGQLPDDPVELLLRCTAATISPQEETGLDPEEEALLLSLEHADWLGAVVSAVRAGPGSDASPSALVAGIAACPEVESVADFEEESASLEAAFWILDLPWQLLGVIDAEQRLTAWGAWALPRALARAWQSSFEREG